MPDETLLFDDRGTQVATVIDGVVKLKRVEILRDFGRTVELRDGLAGGETVILSPYTSIADGQKVEIAAAK